MHTLQPNPSAIWPLLDVDLRRLTEKYPDMSMSPANCVTCGGDGTFRWLFHGEPADYLCDCEEQLYLHQWLLNAGIDKSYQRLGWDDTRAVEPSALKTVLDYVEKIDPLAARGIGLVMHGAARGTGKSLLASLLLKMLIADGYDGFFVTFQTLLDLFTSTWRSNDEKRWFEARICNAGVLVIDDMAREYAGRLGIAAALVDHVLRTRVSAQRPTIVTTNKSLDELGELYSLNSLSLLQGCSVSVEFIGTDFRPRHLERLLDEADRNLTRPIVLS
jgi:DNA replication protein DnaC